MCSKYSPDKALTLRVPLPEAGGVGAVFIRFPPITSVCVKLLLGEILFLMLHGRNILYFMKNR